jgi:hypothetical protein
MKNKGYIIKGGYMLSAQKKIIAGLMFLVFTVPGFGNQGDSSCTANINVLKKSNISVGAGWADLKDLNSRLSGLGLSEFRPYGLSLGLEHQTAIGRMMMGGQLKGLFFKDRLTGNTKTSFMAGEILLHSGFNVINTEHVNLYPYLGLGAGLMNLVVGDKNTPFDTALVRPNTNLNIHQGRFLIDLGVGFDLLGGKNPSRLGLLGLRAGYTFDPTKADRWMRDGLFVTSAPKPALSGAYVLLTLGGAERKTLDAKAWKHRHGMWHHEGPPAADSAQ